MAELAEQITMALRDELLYGKRTPQRQAAHEKSGIRGFYDRNKKWLSRKKTEILNWQKLSDAQKQALTDAEYLLTELPTLATVSPHYRGVSVNVNQYLQIVMNDPDYHYDAKAMELPDVKSTTMTTISLPPELLQDKYRYWTFKQQACQAALCQQAAKWNYDQRAVDQWCKKVGGAQTRLPAHVVNEYCRADRAFEPCPSEWEEKLPRSRGIDIWDRTQSKYIPGSWFIAPSSKDSLGYNFAVVRDEGKASLCPCLVGLSNAHADLKALQSLWKRRTQQLELLKSQLLSVVNQSQVYGR